MSRADRFWRWCARHLPSRLLYWAAITVWARATCGKWGHTDAPSLTMSDAIKRMETDE